MILKNLYTDGNVPQVGDVVADWSADRFTVTDIIVTDSSTCVRGFDASGNEQGTLAGLCKLIARKK